MSLTARLVISTLYIYPCRSKFGLGLFPGYDFFARLTGKLNRLRIFDVFQKLQQLFPSVPFELHGFSIAIGVQDQLGFGYQLVGSHVIVHLLSDLD